MLSFNLYSTQIFYLIFRKKEKPISKTIGFHKKSINLLLIMCLFLPKNIILNYQLQFFQIKTKGFNGKQMSKHIFQGHKRKIALLLLFQRKSYIKIQRIEQPGIKSYLCSNTLNKILLLQQMKIAFVFILGILLATNCFVIKQEYQDKAPPVLSGLQGFDNRVGQSFGDEKAATFLNLINTASTLYRDDMEKNLKYIQANMETAYGKPNETYSVIIQSNSTPSITKSWVYNTWGDTYASYSSGVSLINPTWSFMCYILEKQGNDTHEYVPRSGQGAGIILATINTIKTLVLEKEKKGKCTCRQALDIREGLSQYDRQLWSALCHSQPISEGYVLVKDKQWVSANPQSCYYLFFVIT